MRDNCIPVYSYVLNGLYRIVPFDKQEFLSEKLCQKKLQISKHHALPTNYANNSQESFSRDESQFTEQINLGYTQPSRTKNKYF